MGEGGGYVPMITQGTVIETPVYCLQGNGIDRAETAGCNGKGWREDQSYTLNTIDRPAIAFAQNQRNEVRDLGDLAGALAAEPGVHQQTYVAKCLNPWDVQSKHIQPEDGITESLYSGECRYGGGESYVLSQKDNDT